MKMCFLGEHAFLIYPVILEEIRSHVFSCILLLNEELRNPRILKSQGSCVQGNFCGGLLVLNSS